MNYLINGATKWITPFPPPPTPIFGAVLNLSDALKNYLLWSYKWTYPEVHLFNFIDSTVKFGGGVDFIYTLYTHLINNTNYLGLEHSCLSCKIFTLTFTITNIRTPVHASRSILPSRPAASPTLSIVGPRMVSKG